MSYFYEKYRLNLFHGKNAPLIHPWQALRETELLDAHRQLQGIFIAIASGELKLRNLSGGLTYYGFKASMDGVFGDSARGFCMQSIVKEEEISTLDIKPEELFLLDKINHLISVHPTLYQMQIVDDVSKIPAGYKVGTIGIAEGSRVLLTVVLPDLLDLAGVDVLELEIAVQLRNVSMPRSF